MILFETGPGSVTVVNDPTLDVPLPVLIGGLVAGAGSGALKCILTDLAVRRGANYQIIHSMSDLIYAYAFGDRVGPVRASGITFPRFCDESFADPSGTENLLAYYAANNISVTGTPVPIVVGTSGLGVMRGFLVGLDAGIARPQDRIGTFALEFVTLPVRRGG